MAEKLSLEYSEMLAETSKLTEYANEFENYTNLMTSSVNTLCDNWISESTKAYQEDYMALAQNFSNTLEVVRSLIASTNQYIADMQSLDAANSQPKVTVG